MTLQDLGYKRVHEEAFLALNRSDLVPARVSRQDRERYQIQTPARSFLAEVSGRYRYEAVHASDFPVVGDWVAVSVTDDDGSAIIHDLLPRLTTFSRKVAGETTREQVVAANVDVVFLVSGLDHDFNLRRIERYVTLAYNSGARPVIVLNKVDLADDLDRVLSATREIAAGADVLALSATTNEGLSAIRQYLIPGQTIALLGSSGVGKSTIVNNLLGETRLKTGAVREDDSRGRHTTTSRELFILPEGGILIDTPGMRELQLWADEDSLKDSFAEIEDLAASCRFADCKHETEPGCAIRAALESEELSAERYRSFLKLRRELAFLERRKTESTHEERKRDRSTGKLYKSIQRHNRKNR